MPRLRLLLAGAPAAALAVVALTATTPSAADARVNVAIGLGDQSPAMFASPLFKPLKVKRVRYFIRWDAIEHPHALEAADAYVAAARAANARVLMHITTNDYRKRRAKLPSVNRYRGAVGALIHRYRPLGVREWGVWNEANHPSEPTWKNPRRAAQFFQVMRARCRGCTIVALDLLDMSSSPRYIDRFYRALGRRDRAAARIIGIHAYAETNRHVAGRTETIIRSVRAHNRRATFWLTETGGIVRLLDAWRCNTGRAATALRAMFRLASRHRRDIRRVYAYSFFGEQPGCALRDYGLVTWNGKQRKGYRVFRRYASGFAR